MARFVAIVLVVFVGLVVLTLVASNAGCHQHWQASGMRSDWGFVQGCMVEVSPGRWIPEKNYRDFTP